jgi:hypothetical protein
MILVKQQGQQSFVRSEDVATDKDLDSDTVAIELIPQKLEVCQLDVGKVDGKATESGNDNSSTMHYQDRKDDRLKALTDSAVDDSGESLFISSSTLTSDAEDEDEPLDALKDKGWMDEAPKSSSPLEHEMNGQVLPINNPSDFGDVCIKNSSNVHLGSRVFYKGPVTIKQFVYTNSATVSDDASPEGLQYDAKQPKESSTDCNNKSFCFLSNHKCK